MSYMTPYYFSASIGQTVSVWMRSTDFQSKVGIAFSGSTTKLAESSNTAWGCGDTFYGSAFRYTCPSSSVYKVETTSTGPTDTGSFKLYITPAETSSVDMMYSGSGAGMNLVYSPIADKIYGIGFYDPNFPNSPTASVCILDPKSNVITNSLYYVNTRVYSEFYNPHTDTVWVWLSGSNALWDGEFLVEYQGSGDLVTSHSVSNIWPPAVIGAGLLAYNSASNQVLMVTNVAANPSTASIYDCLSNTIVQYVPLSSSATIWPAYAASNNSYYVYANDNATGAQKINATSYGSSVITSMTGSGYGFSYVPEVDRLFHENETGTACVVVDPATDTPVATIPGIIDFQWAVYDPCGKSIAISDDNSTNNGYSDGGVSYVGSSSFLPTNFQHLAGNWPMVYCSSTSTVFVGNWNDDIVYSFFSTIPTASLPQPAYPPVPPVLPLAPIYLEVSSGSAVLDWIDPNTGSVVDYYVIQKSTTGASGSYSEIGTSPTTHSVDQTVSSGNTYWYRVASVNSQGTSSFSNLAAIDIIPCSKADFDPIVHAGYISYQSASTYRNTYGVLIPYNTTVSQSISVWSRSPDFDTYITLVDDIGNVLIENDWDGWDLTGDVAFGAAAFTYTLPSGSYNIEVSSANNNFGRYYLYISPGPKLETTWSTSIEPTDCFYVPTSKNVVVGENGSKLVFWDTVTSSSTVIQPPAGIQGACYSPTQDKVYAWVYYSTGGQDTCSIDEYDNVGNLVYSNFFYRSPVNTFPNVDFSGYLSYDRKNDRILFAKGTNYSNPTQSIVIWDCASRTILANLNGAPYRNNGFWMSCYSEIDNSYYVAQSYNASTVPGWPMVKIDAGTFAMSNTATNVNIMVSYISESNCMMVRKPGGKVGFYDPVTDTIFHTQTDLPSSGLFEAAGLGDKCTNVYIAGIDPRNGPNIPAVALLDRNTYLPQNYLVLNSSTIPNPPWTPDGFHGYSLCFNPDDSKVYSAQQTYDGATEGRLYSMRLSRAVAPVLPHITLPSIPLVPSSFSATSGSAILNWTSGSNDQTFFTVQRSPDNATWVQLSTPTASVLTYTDTGVTSSLAGATYYYRIAAVNFVGTSSYTSTNITFTIPPTYAQNFGEATWDSSSMASPPCATLSIASGSGTFSWKRDQFDFPCSSWVDSTTTVQNTGAPYAFSLTVPWQSAGLAFAPYNSVSFTLQVNGSTVDNVVGDVSNDSPSPFTLNGTMPTGINTIRIYFASGGLLAGAGGYTISSAGTFAFSPLT